MHIINKVLYIRIVKLQEGQTITARRGKTQVTGEITGLTYHHIDKGRLIAVFIDGEYYNANDIITNPKGGGRKPTGHTNGRATIYTDLELMEKLKTAIPNGRDSWITKTIREAAINQKLITDKQLNSI